MNREIVLASSSPRRLELLRGIGLQFTVCAVPVDEDRAGPPERVVVELARLKAQATAALHPGALIIGADTLVSVAGQTLGKPQDAGDALRMLRLLQGTWHSVHSGLCVLDAAQDRAYLHHEETLVQFEPLEDDEMRAYIATGEPLDKAGAYAMQGIAGMFVSRIKGSHSNVIGLPLAALRHLLRQAGCQVLG
ncbi:MAG: nucleoside triphosphate pyrophosphatase [Christensenellales bacterium]